MKRALITVDFDILKQRIKTGNAVSARVMKGIPNDAKFIGVTTDRHRASDRIQIVIESQTLDDVPEGELLPEYDIVFQSIGSGF